MSTMYPSVSAPVGASGVPGSVSGALGVRIYNKGDKVVLDVPASPLNGTAWYVWDYYFYDPAKDWVYYLTDPANPNDTSYFIRSYDSSLKPWTAPVPPPTPAQIAYTHSLSGGGGGATVPGSVPAGGGTTSSSGGFPWLGVALIGGLAYLMVGKKLLK